MERVCKMGYEARRKLERFCDLAEFSIAAPEFEELGFHEGVGLLLQVGRADIEGQGNLTKEQFHEFCDSGRELLNHFLGHSAFVGWTNKAPGRHWTNKAPGNPSPRSRTRSLPDPQSQTCWSLAR